jgi:hypothetical protein
VRAILSLSEQNRRVVVSLRNGKEEKTKQNKTKQKDKTSMDNAVKMQVRDANAFLAVDPLPKEVSNSER